MTSTHPAVGTTMAEPCAEESPDEGVDREASERATDRSDTGGRSGEQGILRAVVRIRRRNQGACPLADGEGTRTIEAHDLSCVSGDCAGDFECRATVETDRGPRMVGRVVDEDCVCPVFQEHDCVASVEAVDHGDFVVSITIPTREELPAIIESLRDRGATVDLRSIARTDAAATRQHISVDADAVTEKQREAIRVAFEEGYYERPRQADLGDLANRLGVSRSAVSQRLTGAESTLVEALYEHEARIERA